MELDEDDTSSTPVIIEVAKEAPLPSARYSPFLALSGIAYASTFSYLAWTTNLHWFVVHCIALGVGYAAESLRQSVIKQLKLDDSTDETLIGVVLYTLPLVVMWKVYVLCFSKPVGFVLRMFGIKVDAVKNEHIPMERRKQTAAVMAWILLIPFTPLSYVFAGFLTLAVPFAMIPYLIWVYAIDKAPRTGSRKPWLRNFSLGRHFVNYFPITLTRSSPPLDPQKKYVFCYHPHGIIGLGSVGAIAGDGAGFPELFPGIDRRLLTLDSNFNLPFIREILLGFGLCSVTRKSCDAILSRGPGSAICIVVGGAAEALETAEGTYRLVLSRKGFCRVAVENGANLVPVFAFGETDAFTVLHSEHGSKLRNLQVWAQKKIGFSMPIFWGRGLNSYNVGFLPKRKPINVVTGPPIDTDAIRQRTGLSGDELVTAVHAEYLQALKALFDEHKDSTPAGQTRRESFSIVQ